MVYLGLKGSVMPKSPGLGTPTKQDANEGQQLARVANKEMQKKVLHGNTHFPYGDHPPHAVL